MLIWRRALSRWVLMAAVAARGARRSLVGRLADTAGDGRLGRLGALAAAAVREHLPTLAALGSVDYGAFRAAAAAGWIVTGVSVLLLDWKVRG